MTNNLKAAADLILKAKKPEDVFGIDPAKISKIYRTLATATHPDKYPNSSDKKKAEELFKALAALEQQAQDRMKAGTYGYVWTQIKAKTHTFEVDFTAPHQKGSFCNFYVTKTGEVLKIPRLPDDNDLMHTESAVLAKLYKGPKKLQPYIPQLVTSFDFSDGETHRTNVFKELKGFYSLNEIKKFYPKGINPKDMAWMFRRLLVVLGFTHLEEVIHGAVLPDHILILPEDHGLVLVDWCYATQNDTPKAIDTKYVKWYPNEVKAKQKTGGFTDIYMAAKCMIYILGGDPIKNTIPPSVPAKIATFLKGCLLEQPSMRPNHAEELLNEFDILIQKLWGPKTFHPFHIPPKE